MILFLLRKVLNLPSLTLSFLIKYLTLDYIYIDQSTGSSNIFITGTKKVHRFSELEGGK